MVETATPGALAGIRVIEFGDERAAWCGKLLSDLGAEVILVEPPGGCGQRGHPPLWEAGDCGDRSLPFLYMNAGKRSVCLDPAAADARASFARLLAGADLVLDSAGSEGLQLWGLDWEQLHARHPALVYTAITGFGQTGPHRSWHSTDIVAAAMSGAMGVIGHPEDPPVALVGEQAHIMAGTTAAVSSLVALHHAARTGQGQLVDISVQEAMLAVSSISGVGKWLDDGIIPQRYGAGLFAAVPSGTYPCRDGSIYLIINRPLHWQGLARWVNEETGNREILDPMFEGPSANRQAYRELLDLYIGELTGRYNVEDFYREGQRRHLAVTPLSDAHGIASDRHLRERGFFVPVEHGGKSLLHPGPPYRLAGTPWRIAGGAPAPGEHDGELGRLLARRPREHGAEQAEGGALAGLRVLEFTAGMAGPWIGRTMAWCGADVIKVESRGYPDVTRLYVPPRQPELGPQSQVSPWFTDWNAGKRFVSLDLTNPEAVALARQLVAECDVVIDNNGSGVLDKLGLGFEELQRDNPGLVLLSSTGYGKFGPDAGYISWGPNIETLSGLAELSGFARRDCTMTQFAYPDPLSALYGLCVVLAALEHRRKTGAGQIINLSQLEATVASIGHVLLEVLANDREPAKLGNGSLRFAPQGCYPCRGEERWCVLSVGDDRQWQALCEVLRQPDWLADSRFTSQAARLDNREALDQLLAAASGEWEATALMEALQAAGVPAGVVQNVEDQYRRDPHLAARRYFETIPHQLLGEVVAPGIALGLTATPGSTPDSGRPIGSDNEAVFRDLLGLGAARYRELVAAGAIEA